MAFAIYSLSAIYLGKLFKVHNLLFLTLSGIVFVLNPFNLENFAFMFDSLLELSLLLVSYKTTIVNRKQILGQLSTSDTR